MVPTRDHELIRAWAEEHDAAPAEIRRLVFDGEPSILSFLFGEARIGTEELQPISWDDFFARFDLLELSMGWAEHSSQFAIVRVGNSKMKTIN